MSRYKYGESNSERKENDSNKTLLGKLWATVKVLYPILKILFIYPLLIYIAFTGLSHMYGIAKETYTDNLNNISSCSDKCYPEYYKYDAVVDKCYCGNEFAIEVDGD